MLVSTKSTVYQVLRQWAQSHPNRIYLCSPRGPISYGEAHAITTRLAYKLRHDLGLAAHSILAVQVDNPEHLLYLIWACTAAGITLVFISETFDPVDLNKLTSRLGVKGLVTDNPKLLTVLDGVTSCISLIRSVLTCGVAYTASDSLLTIQPNALAFIFQTSGTTGEAKLVEVRHEQFLRAITCLRHAGGLQHAENQAVYLTPPLSHSYGLSSLLEYTSCGSTIVLPSGRALLGAISGLQSPFLADIVTAIEGVPYFYEQLTRLLDRIRLPKLHHVGFGGGAIDPAMINRLRNVYPALSYSVRDGMTETPSVVSHKRFIAPYQEDWKSSGHVLPIYDLRIVDEAGQVVGPYHEGEIYLKGPCIALPYFGEVGSHHSFWATGDIGYLDKNRELFIVGRRSLYLKNRGFRMSPESIESVVCSLDGIQECRVSMQNDQLLVEIVRSHDAITARGVVQFLTWKLPSYAIPQDVRFVEIIPRTPSGKIKRYC